MLRQHDIEIRVRYNETDSMGFVHHSHYLTYCEIGRTDMLRAAGGSYRQMERDGLFIVVVKAELRYRSPARYDDLLRLRTTITRAKAAKIQHRYELFRDDERLFEGLVTLAVIDRAGSVQRVPEWMQID